MENPCYVLTLPTLKPEQTSLKQLSPVCVTGSCGRLRNKARKVRTHLLSNLELTVLSAGAAGTERRVGLVLLYPPCRAALLSMMPSQLPHLQPPL